MGQTSRNRTSASEGADTNASYNDQDDTTCNDSPADSSCADDVKNTTPAENRKTAMLGWKDILVSTD